MSAIYTAGPLLVSLVLLGITAGIGILLSNRRLHASLKFLKIGGRSLPSEESHPASDAKQRRNANKDREHGEWTGVDFKYPHIEPCKERLTDIKPIPYRPFKWGAYHVTMGLKSMPWNDWIELDRDFETYHRIKKHRMELRGDKAVQVLSDSANSSVRGGAFAAIELVHRLAEFLSRRYPAEYTVRRHPERPLDNVTGPKDFADWGWDDLPPVRYVKIEALGVEYELPLRVGENTEDGCEGKRAMEIAGLLVQDDLALMIEGNDGRYYFQAGSICVPGFWRMQDKIGMPLDDIHLSGNVPQYKERLQPSLDRFFRKLPVDKPVTRINYFVQTRRRDGEHEAIEENDVDPDELGWATSSLGDEDDFENGTHATAKPKSSTSTQQKEPLVDWLRLRVERQTLLRLPRSGAVVFTIRVYTDPIVKLVQESGVPGRLASALRSWPMDVAGYKGKNRGGWWDVLLRYLDEEHEAEMEGTEDVGKMDGRLEIPQRRVE